MKAPCLNCPDRKVGCHSECTKYLKFQQHKALLREQKSKYSTDDHANQNTQDQADAVPFFNQALHTFFPPIVNNCRGLTKAAAIIQYTEKKTYCQSIADKSSQSAYTWFIFKKFPDALFFFDT